MAFATSRHATEEDIPELVRTINSAYRVEDFFVDGDRTTEADIAARIADPAVHFLVIDAANSGALAAAVVMDVRGRRGHFAMLSVDPPYQGQGLGRLLMKVVEDHCRAAGCDSLDIEVVNLREELPAFYAEMGFSPTGTAPFPPRATLRREAHLVLMTKPLNAETRLS